LLPLLLACTPAQIQFEAAFDEAVVSTHDTAVADTAEATGPVFDTVSADVHPDMGSLVVMRWDQQRPAEVQAFYTFEDDVWHHAPAVQRDAGAQEQLIVGVPYGYEVTVRLVGGGEETETFVVTTDELPEDAPAPELLAVDEDRLDPDTNFVFGGYGAAFGNGDYWAFVIDRKGRLVWTHQAPSSRIILAPRVSWDGTTFLVDHNSYWGAWDGGTQSEVVGLKIDGSETAVYDTPGLHHPFTDLPDGSLAWGVMSGNDETLEILRPDGEQERLWTCSEFLFSIGESDYCGSNTLTYVEETDTFLFSFYSLDSVVEIDHATGEEVRVYGHVDGAYDFSPFDSSFWWQHGAHYTDTGTFMVSTKDQAGGNETVVREYEVDHDAEELVEVWSFGDGEGIYGDNLGEAWKLPGGNVLHNYGQAGRLREVTTSGDVVWDVVWSTDGIQWLGKTTGIDDLYAFLPTE